EFDRLTRQLSDAEGELYRVDAEIRSAKERSEHGRRMSAELEDRVRSYESEIEVTRLRLAEYGEEKEKLGGELTALAAEAGLRETELTRSEDRIREARGVETERSSAIRDVNRRREEVLARGSKVRNERASVATTLRSGEVVEERIERRAAAIRSEQDELIAKREGLEADRAAKDERETDVRVRLEAAEKEVGSLEERLADLSGQASAADSNLSGWRSRLDVLESLKARREGMNQSVKRILEEAEREDSTLTGILGVVADLVKVEGPDAAATELAIGACAQGIVTETLADALAAIEFLKREELGRALFLPLEELREAGPVVGDAGDVRPAKGGARATGGHDRLLEALLSDTVIVSDVDAARRFAGNGGRSLRIITGGGEVLGRIGNISGGAGQAATTSLLTRNAEIEELSRKISAEEEKRGALEEALTRLRENHHDLRTETRTLREELTIASREAREAEAGLDRCVKDLARLADETHVLTVEGTEISEQRRVATSSAERLDREAAELAVEEEALRNEAAGLETSLAEARETTRTAEGERTELSVALARSRERLAGSEERAKAIERAVADARRSLDLAAVEAENCRLRRDESRLEAETAEREAADGEKQKEGCQRRVSDVRRKHQEARATLLSRRGEADGLREEHEKYRGALEDFRLRENEIRLKLEGLVERIAEEFELDLVDLHEGFIPEEIDWEELDREVGDLKRKIDRMGNVNMEAIDQLQEVDERVKFLNGEEADLNASREQLTEILRKVNRESRERFETAFAEIREHFRVMYRKLFGGGSADILLEEGEDILEAGIEILCRPPGRELQNLNLLSGGEKTLTAVALLFAIFKARPSPFALMDEVDAALDESNIDRFLTVLREFTHESQFIIITHNKRTMTEADALYGVSMPELGVSQPMSIRFAKEAGPNGNGGANGNGSNGAGGNGEVAKPAATAGAPSAS
ncbi:MAG: chromosome segregation protein SMC, partial [Planctomycetota bacterium]